MLFTTCEVSINEIVSCSTLDLLSTPVRIVSSSRGEVSELRCQSVDEQIDELYFTILVDEMTGEPPEVVVGERGGDSYPLGLLLQRGIAAPPA